MESSKASYRFQHQPFQGRNQAVLNKVHWNPQFPKTGGKKGTFIIYIPLYLYHFKPENLSSSISSWNFFPLQRCGFCWMANFFSSGLSHFKMFWVFRACCSDISDVRFVPNRSCLFCPWDKRLAEDFYVTDSVSSFGYIYIYWVVPPPRIPVTTRITMFLAGDPYKPEFATVARRGGQPKIYSKKHMVVGCENPKWTHDFKWVSWF